MGRSTYPYDTGTCCCHNTCCTNLLCHTHRHRICSQLSAWYLWCHILCTSADSRSTFHIGHPQTTYRGVLVDVSNLHTPTHRLVLSFWFNIYRWLIFAFPPPCHLFWWQRLVPLFCTWKHPTERCLIRQPTAIWTLTLSFVFGFSVINSDTILHLYVNGIGIL